MKAQNVYYKMPRARQVSEFCVYPFVKDDTQIRLQSDHHCIIVDLMTGKSFVSKRFAQYPHFMACMPENGGKVIDTPKEITDQLNKIIENPTGHSVCLVGST